MSKIGLPYLPSTLVWTKKSLDKYPLVYPTYLSKTFGHFGIKSCLSFLHIFGFFSSNKARKRKYDKQTFIPKCPNFLERQVGQTRGYLSKLFFVHTRVLGRQGRPILDICPKFRRFFFWDPLLSLISIHTRAQSMHAL